MIASLVGWSGAVRQVSGDERSWRSWPLVTHAAIFARRWLRHGCGMSGPKISRGGRSQA